jgi:prevent-host-death family protein
MRDIAVTEAKAKLLQFLDEVERGASFRVTRHGRPIARIVPEHDERVREVQESAAAIRAIRSRSKGMTVEEILSAKEQGRRF